jgi:hypothetical protein
MEGESLISFLGVSVMLGAVLMLLYQAGQPNSRPQRTVAFAVLLLGELLLFPWDSPVEWLRVGIIAGANYVIGADRRMLNGVIETIRDLFRKPPTGGTGGSTPLPSSEGARADMVPAQDGATNAGVLPKTDLTPLELVRRMIWPDLAGWDKDQRA